MEVNDNCRSSLLFFCYLRSNGAFTCVKLIQYKVCTIVLGTCNSQQQAE